MTRVALYCYFLAAACTLGTFGYYVQVHVLDGWTLLPL